MRARMSTLAGAILATALVLGSAACGSRVSPEGPSAAEPVTVAEQAQIGPLPPLIRIGPPETPDAAALVVAPTQQAPASTDPVEQAPVAQSRPEPPALESEPAPEPKPLATPPLRPDGRPGPVADRTPARFAAPADRYALLIGVENYRPPTHDTVAGADDVALIRQALLSAGWLAGNIRILTDEQATGDAIRSGMNWLQARSVAGKTFSFFHYSGHVKQFGNQHETLWPIDRDWVDDRELATQMAQVRGRMWIDISGCEAGSFLPGLNSRRVLFTGSSQATEKSYEHPGWQTSVWTGLLFRTAPARADADNDGRVVMGEALRYARHFAPIVTAEQDPHGPQHPVIAGDTVLGWTLSRPPA